MRKATGSRKAKVKERGRGKGDWTERSDGGVVDCRDVKMEGDAGSAEVWNGGMVG